MEPTTIDAVKELKGISAETLLIALMVFCALLGIYNLIATAMKNHREEKARQAAPTDDLRTRMEEHERILAKDKARIEALERKTDDLTIGQRATVKGIQALLEHALHDGNTDQLQSASEQLTNWLTDR